MESLLDFNVIFRDVGCQSLRSVTLQPWLLLPLIIGLIPLIYRILHPTLLPGRSSVLHVILPDGQIYPRASTLSFWSHWQARWAWRRYAHDRGVSPAELTKSIRNDYEIDWAHGETPEKGQLICAWGRVFEWNDDSMDMVTLERMRTKSDDLSDKALDILADSRNATSRDVLESIADHVQACDSHQKVEEDGVLHFWKASNRLPPIGCGAVGLDWYRKHGIITPRQEKEMGHCSIDKTLVDQPNWSPLSEEIEVPEHLQKLHQEEQERVIRRGQAVFRRYGPNITLGQLLVGLGGGFASGRITDVLKSTGYLMDKEEKKAYESDTAREKFSDATHFYLHNYIEQGQRIIEQRTAEKKEASGRQRVPAQASKKRTYKRLLETATFLVDVMDSPEALLPPINGTNAQKNERMGADALQGCGVGWLACSRVRFLHTGVRRRLRDSEHYPSSSGVPINQEDLMATLCAFAVVPLLTLQMTGLPPTPDECQDFIAVWRHIGFYMGIEPRLLRRCFRDTSAAQMTFSCISSHHFLPLAKLDGKIPPPPTIGSDFGPSKPTIKTVTGQEELPLPALFDFNHGPALPLLWAVADQPPGNLSFSSLCGIARFLLGDSMANATTIPSVSLIQYIGLRIRLFVLVYPPLFGRYYPRKQWAEELGGNWHSLLRRIVFFCNKGQYAAWKSSAVGGYGGFTEAVAPLDPKEGQRTVNQHRRLIREMAIVTTLTGVFAAGALALITWQVLYLLGTTHSTYCATA